MSNWNSSVPLPTSDSDSSTMVGEDEVFSDIDSADEEEKIAEGKDEDDIQEEKYEETGVKCQTDEVTCAICYTALYVGNSVTTRCNHNYCKKCFFRWIEVNATCPQCRAPIDSNTNLTDEQLSKEMSDLYQGYLYTLAAIIVSGVLMFLFGVFRLGALSEFFPSSALQGMLAAIGVGILSKQVHVMIGVTSVSGKPLQVLSKIPESLKILFSSSSLEMILSALLGLLSLVLLVFYSKLRTPFFQLIPAPMLVVFLAVGLNYYYDLI